MNISIIGSGYVGLGVAAGFYGNGHTVRCIDKDKSKADLINQGKSPIYEEGLDDLLSTYVDQYAGSFVSTDYHDILQTDITYICVGTPSQPDGSIDLAYIKDAVAELGEVLSRKNGAHTVVIKSTIVPGTTNEVIIPLLEKHSGKKIGNELGIVVNPEFLEEGRVVYQSRNPYRIIIGASDQKTGDIVEQIYKHSSAPIIRTDITTAEMIKYASNAFLAAKISFINEIGNICKKLGVDVYDVAQGMGHDPRIGEKFLNAGVGFGGSCLPKDVEALIIKAKETNCEANLLTAISNFNKEQPMKMVQMAQNKIGSLENKKVAVLGLAFKPNTNDIRQAPAITIIAQLLTEKSIVKAYDPQAMSEAKEVFPQNVVFCDNASDTIAESDCILIVTEWDEFRDENLYKGKLVIDGRRVLDPVKASAICEYEGICW